MASQLQPPYRKLRGYAFDPSLSLQMETVEFNHIVYKVEWERLELRNEKGTPMSAAYPAGEYIEIIDYDPASDLFYQPVDLNDPYLLAQDGLDPSVSNPQFHQQMVYAVIMITIKNFEKALGRKIQWARHLYLNENEMYQSRYVPRLRIYPHALRQANAYYHPLKKALLFGYFPASPASAALQLPGGTVFTCLSHDIIAHETTHAILDGLHRRYIDPTHPDTRAFHEAFADIIALFQHFTFPEVLKQQIAKTRGDLATQNLLGQLAQEFGRAVGSYGGLRDAIGAKDSLTGNWVPHQPSPDDYTLATESHDKGAVLVATIFEAFTTIYKLRIKGLVRIASGGSGILSMGELHPELVNQMADAAAKTAAHVLNMCVRALDYCPPIDITFGDYLRAIMTADRDMIAEDDMDYRVAFIEAFQKRGIFPKGIKSMSIESLCYQENPQTGIPSALNENLLNFLRDFKNKLSYLQDRTKIDELTREFISGEANPNAGLHKLLDMQHLDPDAVKVFERLTGIQFYRDKEESKKKGFLFSGGTSSYQVDKLWLASRVSPKGKIINHVIVTLIQKRGILVKTEGDTVHIAGYSCPGEKPPDSYSYFEFRGGCTLIFDLDTLCLRYAIKKDVNDTERMENQFRYQQGLTGDAAALYFDKATLSNLSGPFAFMHSH